MFTEFWQAKIKIEESKKKAIHMRGEGQDNITYSSDLS